MRDNNFHRKETFVKNKFSQIEKLISIELNCAWKKWIFKSQVFLAISRRLNSRKPRFRQLLLLEFGTDSALKLPQTAKRSLSTFKEIAI